MWCGSTGTVGRDTIGWWLVNFQRFPLVYSIYFGNKTYFLFTFSKMILLAKRNPLAAAVLIGLTICVTVDLGFLPFPALLNLL